MVQNHLDDLICEWHTETSLSDTKKRNLDYFSKDGGSDNLLRNFDGKQGLWPTLQSMRNVENTALMKLLSGVKRQDAK